METGSQQNCLNSKENCVLVCQYTSCQAAGSEEVLAAFEKADLGDFNVVATGCQGQCSSGPTVRVVPEETWYCRVKPTDVPKIAQEHLKGGKPIDEKLNSRIHMRFSF